MSGSPVDSDRPICKSIAKNFKWAIYITTTGGLSSYQFALQDALNAYFVVWEKTVINTNNVNQLKSFLGGSADNDLQEYSICFNS